MEPPSFLQEMPLLTTVKASKELLKQNGLKHSFDTRHDLVEFVTKLQWPYTMPWRKEQRECLEKFCSLEWNELVVQAIFGGGKTTMMLAMVQHLLLHHHDQIQICAFNVCIKNEIKKKLRFLGFRKRVQTFDSIIYELCAELGYENLRVLDFEGKRKFVQQHLAKVKGLEEVTHLFVDEAQDLETFAYHVFRKRYPNAKRVFVGDVFQSIQKEPRESMLWNMLRRPDDPQCVRYSMTDTPRVPQSVLGEIQTALTTFYPEFSSTIERWTSSSLVTHDVPIVWTPFESYKSVYEDMLKFIQEKGAENVMILTFSSAITVRGALGDVSRVRQFLMQNGIPVNSNHKRLKDGCVFLSTANSSKGLERDHVFGFLSFPLELAFANFSDDLVVNLTTVALSRCKKSVSMYIPRFQDRFSKVLTLYDSCPLPLVHPKNPVVNKKLCKTTSDTFFEDRRENKRDMLEKEHSITEALRLSILSFSTKTLLKSFVKKYRTTALTQQHMHKIPVSEEDSTFCGVVFETLVLCEWKHAWPRNSATDGTFSHHDIFQAFQSKIHSLRKEYSAFTRRHPSISSLSLKHRVDGACLYAKLHLACFQKIFCRGNAELVARIQRHWASISGTVASLKPAEASLGSLKVQHNLGMPFLNGIADALLLPPASSTNLVEVFEIKASKSQDWQENAMLQSILYGIALGKSLFRVHLVNVFCKESCSYVVNFGKDFFKVRDRVVSDVQQWNLNCFLSKNVTHHDASKKTMNLQGTFFLDGRPTPPPGKEKDSDSTSDEKQKPVFFLAEMVSPTKTYMHPIENLVEELPAKIRDFGIRKIVVGRHLQEVDVESLCPEHPGIFRRLKWSQKCFTVDASWQLFLKQIGWFEHEYDKENKKSYLEWQHPQCSFMVQWAQLSTQYNFDN
jgi:hypothetical protein